MFDEAAAHFGDTGNRQPVNKGANHSGKRGDFANATFGN